MMLQWKFVRNVKINLFTNKVSAPSFKLSGSGWYETDFKNNSKKKSVTKPKKEKQND
jgi:predicted nucleic acid-binding Zn ribbon protein